MNRINGHKGTKQNYLLKFKLKKTFTITFGAFEIFYLEFVSNFDIQASGFGVSQVPLVNSNQSI
jgi:hypothetical protein